MVGNVWINNIQCYLAASHTTPNSDLTSYKSAMRSLDAPLWLKAVEEEMHALKENGTWVLVDLPDGW